MTLDHILDAKSIHLNQMSCAQMTELGGGGNVPTCCFCNDHPLSFMGASEWESGSIGTQVAHCFTRIAPKYRA